MVGEIERYQTDWCYQAESGKAVMTPPASVDGAPLSPHTGPIPDHTDQRWELEHMRQSDSR